MKEKKYKQSLEEIESIINHVENDNPDVDELSDLVKKAVELIKECKQKLRQTEEDLNKTIEGLEE